MEFFVELTTCAFFVFFYLAEFWNEKLLKPVEGSTGLSTVFRWSTFKS